MWSHTKGYKLSVIIVISNDSMMFAINALYCINEVKFENTVLL